MLPPSRDIGSSIPHGTSPCPHGRLLDAAVIHSPERSGLPSAVRGAGADRSGAPAAVRGRSAVRSFTHCAPSGNPEHSVRTIAPSATRLMAQRPPASPAAAAARCRTAAASTPRLGSFLNCELITNSGVRYSGSLTTVVTMSHVPSSGSVNVLKNSLTVARSL